MAYDMQSALPTGFLKPVDKVDIHVHAAKISVSGLFSPEQRMAFDRIQNIGKSILLTEPAIPAANKDIMDESAALWDSVSMKPMDAYSISLSNPDHFAWMCNIHLDGTDAPREELKRYKELGACGVGEFTQNLPFDHPWMEQLFSWCQELELPFLFHISPDGSTYGVVDLPGLPLLEGALRKFSKLKFIGHSQPFWFEMSQYPTDMKNEERNQYPTGKVIPGRVPYLLRTYDNLYGDLSADSGGNAILRDPDYGLVFLNEFQDKLMYGSDTVWYDLHYPLGLYLDSLLHQAKISSEVYSKICRKNAERIFGF